MEMGKDECKLNVLSCFRGEQLFHTLKHGNLLRDFSSYLGYVLFTFSSSLSSSVTPDISNSSVMEISVLSQWNLGVVCLSHNDCLVLYWISSHTVFLVAQVYTSEVFVDGFLDICGLFVGIKYLRVTCIGRQTAVSDDMDEVVPEYAKYQRTQDASSWNS